VSADPQTGRVVVQGGLTLRRLNALLAQQGLGLTNMGDVDAQTITGALSTGTHGTGRDSGALGTQVLGLELVLADGSLMTCSQSENPDVFAAVRVSLGALGIVTSVTLQAEPAFLLAADERPMRLDAVLEDFEQHVADNEHFELYWFPGTRTALTKRNNRATTAAPLGRVRTLLEDEVLGNGNFEATCRRRSGFPRPSPASTRAIPRPPRLRTSPTSPARVHPASGASLQGGVDTRSGVPAARGLLRELRTLPERHGLQITLPDRGPPTAGGDIALYTASGAERVRRCAFFKGNDGDGYFAAVEALMGSVGGGAALGQSCRRSGAEQLRSATRGSGEFTALRDRLDPERRFTNPYLDRVLGA
jgi:FAD/FMN-containing dehydrogenase